MLDGGLFAMNTIAACACCTGATARFRSNFAGIAAMRATPAEPRWQRLNRQHGLCVSLPVGALPAPWLHWAERQCPGHPGPPAPCGEAIRVSADTDKTLFICAGVRHRYTSHIQESSLTDTICSAGGGCDCEGAGVKGVLIRAKWDRASCVIGRSVPNGRSRGSSSASG